MLVEVAFSRSSVNKDIWSWETIPDAFSWCLFIRLINVLLWNIHANEQQLNSEAIKAFIGILVLWILMNSKILAKAFSLRFRYLLKEYQNLVYYSIYF